MASSRKSNLELEQWSKGLYPVGTIFGSGLRLERGAVKVRFFALFFSLFNAAGGELIMVKIIGSQMKRRCDINQTPWTHFLDDIERRMIPAKDKMATFFNHIVSHSLLSMIAFEEVTTTN